jgi:glucose/arabinose dehydrogenase
MHPMSAQRPNTEARLALESLETRIALAITDDIGDFNVVRVADGLDQPLYVTAPPDDASRLFIVEKNTGAIKILDLNSGNVLAQPFLDLPDTSLSTVSEQGLLGLAFDPDYAINGYFYINYTAAGTGATVVERYQVSLNANIADPNSGTTIITYAQPADNHNGGWIGFGPDGFLYIASGDGGGNALTQNNAQDTNSLLGKILRIDVSADAFPGDPSRFYRVPSSNPYVGSAGADEIFSYGLRNPWRMSFDRVTGDLWLGDVGEAQREEINVIPAGGFGNQNFGWKVMEGDIAFDSSDPNNPPPNSLVFTDPIHVYPHTGAPDGGSSVTGGYVYRGPVSSLNGVYFFGDFTSSQIWALRYDGSNITDFANVTGSLTPDVGTINSIASFGEDAAGNLYVVDLGGEIFRLEPSTTASGFSGTVYLDANGDNVIDAGEGLGSITVTISGPGGVVQTQSVTHGAFAFDGLADGTYTFSVDSSDADLPAGAVLDTSRTPNGRTFVVSGGVASASLDSRFVNLPTSPRVVSGPGAGHAPWVRALDSSGNQVMSFLAYDEGFTGGVRVAMGDVNGDSFDDFITAAGPGGGPHVKVYDGVTGAEIASFFAYDAAFTGGVWVAAGDINGDGDVDIITGAGAGGGPHVIAFDFDTLTPIQSYFAYDPAFAGGVTVGVSDVDDNGVLDILTGAGAGGGPHVKAFDGVTGAELRSFFAYDPAFAGGVFVAGGITTSGADTIITGAGAGGGPHVKVFDGSTLAERLSFFAYDPAFSGGVRVAGGDTNFDSQFDVITGAGPGGGPHVRSFDGQTGGPLAFSQFAFDASFSGGVNVGGNLFGSTLRVQGGAAPSNAAGITGTSLDSVLASAVKLWSTTDLSASALARLNQVRISLADLPDDVLGVELGNTILMDFNAAGYGWAVTADEQLDASRVDLLTAVAHELGHVIGHADVDAMTDDLMASHLPPGEQRVPGK